MTSNTLYDHTEDQYMLHPHVETKRTRFRPLTSGDGEEFYALLSRLGIKSLPPVDDFLSTFDFGSEVMFAVEARRTGDTLGYASLQHKDPAGHIQAGIFIEGGRGGPGIGGEVSTLLVNYAFATWPEIHKVYFLTTDASAEGFGVGLVGTTLEGSLREHEYFQGRLWDLHYYSVTREEWTTEGVHFLERLVSPAGAGGAASQRAPEA